jgi:hypothetical protein
VVLVAESVDAIVPDDSTGVADCGSATVGRAVASIATMSEER